MIKAIIFDFDGVILESNKAKGLAFVELFKNQDHKFKKQIYEFHINNISKDRDFKIKQITNKIIKGTSTNKNISLLSKKFSKIVIQKVIKSKYIFRC